MRLIPLILSTFWLTAACSDDNGAQEDPDMQPPGLRSDAASTPSVSRDGSPSASPGQRTGSASGSTRAEPGTDSLSLRFVPAPEGSPRLHAIVEARDAHGPVAPDALVVEVEGGTLVSREQGDGESRIVLTLEADGLDQGLPLRVALPDEHMELRREALVLSQVADHWGQPEFVPGLVNTPGWEDSSEISPDGEWLIVSSYTPVDMFSCVLTQSDVEAEACNRSLGAWQAPERPHMPGAERIVDETTIRHRVPSLCLVGEGEANFPVAMPPTSAYGFRRQSDDTFAEPFPIAFSMDGYSVAPFGFSFVGGVQDDRASVVFGFADIRDFDDKGFNAHLYTADLRMGTPVEFGRFVCDTDGLRLEDDITQDLDLPPWGRNRGNPWMNAEQTFVLHDDESVERSTIFRAERASAGDEWSEARELPPPVNVPGSASYQPFVHEGRLFWARDFLAIHSAGTPSGDWMEDAWEQARPEIGLGAPEGPPLGAPAGRIVAIGEPSLAQDRDGVQWLYFVAIRRTNTGFDADIARVRGPGPDSNR